MLNLFPIQWLALLAYFLLRTITGLVMLYLGLRHFKHRQSLREAIKLPLFPFSGFALMILILTELLISSLLIIGLLTQVAALLLIILSVKMLWLKKYFPHHTIPNRITYLLLTGIGLSLLITGAGAFAFDLPI